MIHKKKLKLLQNYNTPVAPVAINPINKQSNYINLARQSLYNKAKGNTDTVDLKMSDEEGLRRAYATDKGVYTFGDKMFVAGTRTLSDWKDDFLHIPSWGNSRNIQRYQDARDELMKHPEVNSAVGHSLGGSVVLELQKNYRHIKDTRTYGAPVWDFNKTEEPPQRFRNYGDPISYFDKNAITTKDYSVYNPFENHSYTSLGKQFETTKTVPIATKNADGSTSLIA